MKYDAIVVGARCAGAPTAMLLARKGYDVLLVDRAIVPSNMVQSTHLIQYSGIAYLKRWDCCKKPRNAAPHLTDGPLIYTALRSPQSYLP